MHWFLATFNLPNTALLSEEETHHATKVLRLKDGDNVVVFDGNGMGYTAKLGSVSGKHRVAFLQEPLPHQEKPRLHLAIAPTKNIDRTEWLVEKATEIGVASFSIFFSENSERRKIRMDRLEKITSAAAKQSHRLYIPEIHGPMKFEELLNRSHDLANDWLAYCGEGKKTHISKLSTNPIRVFIGPEGDFSEKEVETALAKGVRLLSLGNFRLRTETAGLYAVSVLAEA
jgi:16S rRNA (uracil1498-N3)-methyltransferase